MVDRRDRQQTRENRERWAAGVEGSMWAGAPHQRREGILRHLSGTLRMPRRVFTAWHTLKWCESRLVMCDFLWPTQNPGMGSITLLQGICPTQGSNPGLPHCRRILYQLSHKGSPRRLEWVAYPFSRGSSQPRNRTGVSCTAGGFSTNWAMREAHINSFNPHSNPMCQALLSSTFYR